METNEIKKFLNYASKTIFSEVTFNFLYMAKALIPALVEWQQRDLNPQPLSL